MKTITKPQLESETCILKSLYSKFGKVNKQMQVILRERGYELYELGTTSLCFTHSGNIGRKYMANDSKQYFGIGVCNIAVKARKTGYGYSIYRAWVKRLAS